MGMLIDLYTNSLVEFYEKNKELESFNMIGVLSMTSYRAGYDKLMLDEGKDVYEAISGFKGYIESVIDKTSMHEDFFILALVRDMTEYLSDVKYTLGDSISFLLSALNAEDKPQLHGTAKKQIEILTSHQYRNDVNAQIDSWSQIVAKNFTILNMAKYKSERMNELKI